MRVVAITGGSRGIGKAICQLFETDIIVSGSRANGLHVESQYEMDDFVGKIFKDYGRLDVFINNAGVSGWRSVQDLNLETEFAEEMIMTNLFGTLWGCVEAAKVMKGGSIVNISSLAGKRGSANNSVYCASKFAVNGITQSLAKELGPRGIRVNAVCPWYVTTPGLASALNGTLAPHIDINETALGRMPTAQEVAQVVYWLASEEASAITGQCINVDCGVFPQ